jgi:hypothetical protein
LGYRRRSIRISTHHAETLRWLAIKDGWEFADLARVLICLGADASFLSLNNPEKRGRFESRAFLTRAIRTFDAVTGKPTPRGYSDRQSRDTSVLTIRIPKSLDTSIRNYARDSSVNATCELFLVSGLILHMKGQNALLEALSSANQKSNEGHQPEVQQNQGSL